MLQLYGPFSLSQRGRMALKTNKCEWGVVVIRSISGQGMKADHHAFQNVVLTVQLALLPQLLTACMPWW